MFLFLSLLYGFNIIFVIVIFVVLLKSIYSEI